MSGADHPIEPNRAALLLGAIVLGLVALSLRDRTAFVKFRALTESKDRIKRFRRWAISAFLIFGVGGVLVLWLAGRLANLWRLPSEFQPLAAKLGGGIDSSMIFGMSFGVMFVAGLLFLTARRARRGQGPKPGIKGVLPLLPRSPSERVWLALLSVNAGITEEIFFRLAIPLLLFAVTGALIGSLVCACLIFGLVHAYQGLVGVLATTVLGALFTLVYLATGSLILTMIVHLIIDLNTLVFLPWLRARAAAKTA
ncbi:MAG TPA: CPBP family intramembrane glutamic endopeptidase [Caulobacteraceae bacterium]|jgi:membrane protease YdiL (CAAX protease family)